MTPSRPPSTISNDTPSTTARPPIVDGQVLDLEQRRASRRPLPRVTGTTAGSSTWSTTLVSTGDTVAERPRRRGSTASRSPSPRRLKPSVAPTTARPGNTSAPGWTVIVCCSSLEHPPPRRRRHRRQPEVAERGLGEHGEGGDQRQLHDHGRGDVRQDVAPHRAPRRRPARRRRHHVVLGQHARRPRPARRAPARRPSRAPRASDTVHTEPPRAATNTRARISVGRAMSTSMRWAIDSPTTRGVIALSTPSVSPITRRDDDGEDGDEQRRAGADEHLAEQVLAGAVGAERVGPRDRQPLVAGTTFFGSYGVHTSDTSADDARARSTSTMPRRPGHVRQTCRTSGPRPAAAGRRGGGRRRRGTR